MSPGEGDAVAGVLDQIPELIEQGEKFTFENFSHKSERGFPNAFSDDWLVWVRHVANLLNEIDSPAIAGSIKLGIEAKLFGNSQDSSMPLTKLILSGLKAARRVYRGTFQHLTA